VFNTSFFSVVNAIMWSGELQDRDSVMAQFGRLVSNEHGELDLSCGLGVWLIVLACFIP
jgi:hypothetical protein